MITRRRQDDHEHGEEDQHEIDEGDEEGQGNLVSLRVTLRRVEKVILEREGLAASLYLIF